MALGSFSTGVLADLAAEDVERMRALGESLYVEHKSGLRGSDADQLISAVAAFANTVGGWLLIGVDPAGELVPDPATSWLDAAEPSLIDAVRAILRHRIDPLPTFEAATVELEGGPVGVIRVYESSDTPHVLTDNGAVMVREPAGVHDLTKPRTPGADARSGRIYKALQIRTRAELLDLVDRGRRARDRVSALLDPASQPPLIRDRVGPALDAGTHEPQWSPQASVHARIAMHTLSPQFRQWTTTHAGAAVVLRAAEELADTHGLATNWVHPDPSGGYVEIPVAPVLHRDAAGGALKSRGRVALDGAGVAAAALELDPPDDRDQRGWIELHDVADHIVARPIRVAAELAAHASPPGRATVHVDLVKIAAVLMIENGGGDPRPWVPYAAEITLPLDADQLARVARGATYALARSGGMQAWDPPRDGGE